MGCCASTPSTEIDQLASQSELPPPISPQTASPHSFNTRTEKNYAKDGNKDEDATLKNSDTKTTRKNSENEWDLDASAREQHRREHQQKMAEKQQQIEQDKKQLQDLNDKAFDEQVTRQRSKTFVGIYQIFVQYATNANNDKMDIDGVTEALAHFGCIINTNSTFQKLIFSQFDIDKKGEIDYDDFAATMSSFVDHNNEDSMMLLFQMFDLDQDLYLNLEDFARLLLAHNQIAVVITGQTDTKTTVTYNKRQCLKLARKMISKYDSNQFIDKVACKQFLSMMKNLNEEDMIIDNMSAVSKSINVANINLNGISNNNNLYSTPSKSSKLQTPVYTPNDNQSSKSAAEIDT